MDKQEIRKTMQMRRRELPPAVRTRCSAEICGRILERADVQAAMDAHAMFAVYLASPAEIDLAALMAEAGLTPLSGGPYEGFEHWVEQAITRDIAVARKNP